MLNVRKSDPTFTNFVPRTAAEAVDRFVRCRNNGLKAMLIPECLIACAKGLTGKELDMFESWVINPNGAIPAGVKLVEQREIREANDAVFQQNLERFEQMSIDEEPPLPAEDDDVSMQDVDDEKMPVSER